MIDNNTKKAIKRIARKNTFIKTFIYTMMAMFIFHLAVLANGEPATGKEMIEVSVMEIIELLATYLFIYSIPAWFIAPFNAMWGGMTKKTYFKLMQKEIIKIISHTDDSLELQKLQIMMTYYGNLMSAQQLREVKARAGSHSHSHAHAQVNYTRY